ncbi:hypothetical protein [Pseudomonas sp. C2B4]|uniref:hypothetical protein n=1 Tax=Pseudomonas sp. C2B4 TaxID=2735270 RepID=UPI001586BAFD|nr:hypothetical protein [Pseudomonas sp. C2B4]NUU36892.1 hypothetical protein [Pseudomonas sp. C2B4]
MRLFFVPMVTLASLLLVGCSFSANNPTSTLQTDKSPEQYVDCVEPKLKDNKLNPTVSHSNRSYRIVVSSKVAVDNVLETYKTDNGAKVYLYERQLPASTLMTSRLERAALECL